MHPYRTSARRPTPTTVEREALRVGDLVLVLEDDRASLARYGDCTGRVTMICGRVHLVSFGKRGARFYFAPQIVKLAA